MRCSLCGGCCFRSELLALVFMASSPIVALALDAAVEALLALAASLVLDGLTLRAAAEAAQGERWRPRFILLQVHCGLEFFLRLEPRLRSVVHP